MFHKLPKVNLFYTTLLAALMAALGNLLLFYFLQLIGIDLYIPAGQTPTPLIPLPLTKVIFGSVTPALVAGIIFAIVRKFSTRTVRSFFILSLGFLIFSFGGPLGLPISIPQKIGLNLMHVIAALFILGTLYNFNKQSKETAKT